MRLTGGEKRYPAYYCFNRKRKIERVIFFLIWIEKMSKKKIPSDKQTIDSSRLINLQCTFAKMAPSLSQNYILRRRKLEVLGNFWPALYIVGHGTAVPYRSAAQPPPVDESSPVTLTRGIRSLFPSVTSVYYAFLDFRMRRLCDWVGWLWEEKYLWLIIWDADESNQSTAIVYERHVNLQCKGEWSVEIIIFEALTFCPLSKIGSFYSRYTT